MNSVANIWDKKKRKVTEDVYSSATSNYNSGDFGNCCPCMEADYLDTLPIGYRFKPTDEELINYYLKKKIGNLILPKNKICDVNVYEYHPKDITGNNPQAREGEWYFFTPRNRKYANGKRPDRKAGCGFWKATGLDTVIKDNNGKKIGGKRSLVYHEGNSPKGPKTGWMMHEYVAEVKPRERLGAKDMKLDDYVLCRIYNKNYNKTQNIANQQPNVVSNDPENGSTEVPPAEQARVVSNQNVNRPTNFQNENNAVVQLSDLRLNIRGVENNLPNQDFNQYLYPRVQNAVPEVKREEVMVSDHQNARVISFQDINPSIYQRQNSLHYHDPKMGYLPRTSFPKMGTTPLVNGSSDNRFMSKDLLMANRSPCFPQLINQELLAFHEGNGCDQFEFDRYIERMFSQDTNDCILDEEYKHMFDGHMFDGHGRLLDTDELPTFEAPNGDNNTI